MITAGDLRPGTVFELNGDLYRVLTQSQTHLGRGSATVRVKMRNLRTGATVERTFSPDERLQDVRLEARPMQYLYNDDDFYYFMDLETYEQPGVPAAVLGDRVKYLKEGMTLEIAFYDNEPVEIELPVTVELEVIYTEPGFAGDTAQGATKPAETETGLVVQVPLFVNSGDIIRVDTRTGQYLTRVATKS
ncbi:MAG: elongation factor P [Ardenticatenia bacterium]|nr:elongation factor P [Ardenticatenia bacterium]